MCDIQQHIPISLEQQARFDPFRRVDWRWSLAQQLASGEITNRGPKTAQLRSAVEFLGRRAAREPLDNETDHVIADALALYESDTLRQFELEARLLAGETNEAISEKTKVPEPTIEMYERLFFRVRDCRPGCDYLIGETTRWGHVRGFQDHEVRELWAWFGMAGGPLVLDLLVKVLHESRREDEPPSLKVYLRRGACDLMIQTHLAVHIIPLESSPQWFLSLPIKLQLAKASANPVANTNRIYRAVVRCAHQFLETGKVPAPPDWWTPTNASPTEAESKAAPARKKTKGKPSSATSSNKERGAKEPIRS